MASIGHTTLTKRRTVAGSETGEGKPTQQKTPVRPQNPAHGAGNTGVRNNANSATKSPARGGKVDARTPSKTPPWRSTTACNTSISGVKTPQVKLSPAKDKPWTKEPFISSSTSAREQQSSSVASGTAPTTTTTKGKAQSSVTTPAATTTNKANASAPVHVVTNKPKVESSLSTPVVTNKAKPGISVTPHIKATAKRVISTSTVTRTRRRSSNDSISEVIQKPQSVPVVTSQPPKIPSSLVKNGVTRPSPPPKPQKKSGRVISMCTTSSIISLPSGTSSPKTVDGTAGASSRRNSYTAPTESSLKKVQQGEVKSSPRPSTVSPRGTPGVRKGSPGDSVGSVESVAKSLSKGPQAQTDKGTASDQRKMDGAKAPITRQSPGNSPARVTKKPVLQAVKDGNLNRSTIANNTHKEAVKKPVKKISPKVAKALKNKMEQVVKNEQSRKSSVSENLPSEKFPVDAHMDPTGHESSSPNAGLTDLCQVPEQLKVSIDSGLSHSGLDSPPERPWSSLGSPPATGPRAAVDRSVSKDSALESLGHDNIDFTSRSKDDARDLFLGNEEDTECDLSANCDIIVEGNPTVYKDNRPMLDLGELDVNRDISTQDILEHELAGFPEHMQFTDFRQRFEILVPPDSKPMGPVLDEKQATERVLQSLEVERSTFRLGLSQVFLRAGGLAQLEDSREEKIGGTIVSLQSVGRGYLARQRLKRLKLQHLAVSCIQRNVRKFMAIRNWSWWRMYTKIQPLLNVHRTEEELRSREVELEQLKMKFEKVEKERSDFKMTVDKLDTKLSEMTADLSEEHTTSSHATEMLESETAERIRLDRELQDIQTKYNQLQRKFEHTEMDLMQTRMIAASLDDELDEDDDGSDSVYRDRYERLKREMNFHKKKQQQQHEEELEEREKARKQLDRKLTEAKAEAEEQQRQVSNLKRKSQRLGQDVGDLKLHLEEQVNRNAELEKKQRKFDTELHKVGELQREERTLKEKAAKERDALASEKFKLEQELKGVRLDCELTEEKVTRLGRELEDLSTVSQDDQDLVRLKRMKDELASKVLDQEEELDEQAATIQQLEQAKLRLEMAQEKARQQQSKELEERDQEIEETRASAQKRVKALEAQIEEDYKEKQNAIREKREIERKLQNMGDLSPVRDRDVEKRLRRDLRRTKALLEDAQTMLQKHKDGAGSRVTIRQLRNQLEDSEFATAAAIKARKSVEMELQETQQHLEDASRTKQETDDRCTLLGREKNDLQSHLEDREEEYAELLKRYKAVVQQQSVDYITINDQSKLIEELQRENQSLREQVLTLQSQLEFSQSTMVDKQVVVRLEAKIRELESKLELEQSTRARAESQHVRAKEQVEGLGEERDRLQLADQKQQEVAKRLQRQLRDLREEHSELQAREAEASQRKHDLEKKVESLESEYEQCQSDLRLAFKRISNLQAVIEEDIGSDGDSDLDSEYGAESDEESDDLSDLVNTRLSHRASMSSSVDGSVSSRKSHHDTTLTASNGIS